MPKNRNKAIFQLLMMLHHFPLASPAACVTAYMKYYSKSPSGIFETYLSITYDDCEAYCTSKNNCKGFGYQTTTSNCYLSATDTPDPATSSWIFAKKMCLEDLLALLPSTEEITTVAETTVQTTIQLTTERKTTVYLTTNQETTKFTTEKDTTVPITVEIPTTESSPSTLIWTTEQTTDLETTTEVKTTTSGPSFVSSYCTCVCKDTNTSISERIAERKQELLLNVRDLSAFTRKLTCAPDFRPSSTSIGYFGVLILVIWGLCFAFPDILRMVQAFRSRRVKRLLVRVYQQFIALFYQRPTEHR